MLGEIFWPLFQSVTEKVKNPSLSVWKLLSVSIKHLTLIAGFANTIILFPQLNSQRTKRSITNKRLYIFKKWLVLI